MRRPTRHALPIVRATLFFLALAAPGVLAQSGGVYTIRKSTIDGGGGVSASGALRLEGTIGQHDASQVSTNGTVTLRGGFWAAPALPLPDVVYSNGFE